MRKDEKLMEKIVALAKRRGFVYPGSEIYGGLAGFYDWGPLGTKLKRNIKHAWLRDVVERRDDVVDIDAALIMNPKAWEASGHVGGFADAMVECERCHELLRCDDFLSSEGTEVMFAHLSEKHPETIGSSKNPGAITGFQQKIVEKNFTKPKMFNLMLQTKVGAVKKSESMAYLRPETAGGIFVNFKNVLNSNRLKIPFGIAQIGKAFRNEINPRDFVFRMREFEQMELEYFVHPVRSSRASGPEGTRGFSASATSNGVKPETPMDWFDYWVEQRFAWYKSIGLKNVRKREQEKEERAHYSKATTDIEYEFPFGWQEIEGVANRGDFDLQAHAKASKQDLTYFDEESKERYLPYVVEPSAGVERIALALMCEAYAEEKKRVVMKFHPRIAPVKAAVFPLLANKPKLVEKAREIYQMLKSPITNYQLPITVAWDDRGNIGKRYLSQDEIGTPWCITVDFDSLENDDVTVRDRDTTKQERVSIKELQEYLKSKLQ